MESNSLRCIKTDENHPLACTSFLFSNPFIWFWSTSTPNEEEWNIKWLCFLFVFQKEFVSLNFTINNWNEKIKIRFENNLFENEQLIFCLGIEANLCIFESDQQPGWHWTISQIANLFVYKKEPLLGGVPNIWSASDLKSFRNARNMVLIHLNRCCILVT